MTNFADLQLDARVLKAIAETGYETPTPIQEQAIPHALDGRDVLGIAQTGTGKTASFTLPMLTHLAKGRARARMPRSLVLAPTRELAAQVAENFETYSKHLRIKMALLIGGTSFKDQDKLIDRGVDVLIATPGRLLDHHERGKLMLTAIEIMVVDEADRMLDMGFIPDIERIFKLTPFTRQTLFFSATMAPEITRITQEFLSNPVRVEVARQATTAENIEQLVCKHTPSRRDRADREKREVLRRLIDIEGDKLTNGIIFCNRKRDVDIVAKSLTKHGYDAAAIHGDLDQSVRTRTLDGFRDGSLRLLIASDVAARGLDIPSVSHVFNYDVPIHSEDYVHRIGRTGRAGRDGKAISLCMPADEKYLEKIEELVKKQIPVLPSPLAGETVEDKPARSKPKRDEDSPEPRKQRSRSEDKPARKSDGEPRRERGGRGRRGGREGNTVVGLGDHVPAFLMRELRLDDLLAANRNTPEEEAADKAEQAAAEAEDAATDDATPEVTAAEATPEATAPEATPAAEEAPKPKRTRKPRAKKPAKPAESDAEADAETKAPAEPEKAATAADTPTAEEVPAAEQEASAPKKPAKPARKPRKRASAKAVIDEVSTEAKDPGDDSELKAG